MAHTRRCIENAVQMIAENNEATLALEPGRELTPETEEYALQWLEDGNVPCYWNTACGED